MAKWTLTIEEEGGQTHRVDLAHEVYTLGRDPSNDIVLRERNISRRHARLERAGPGRWALFDEGSRFGSFINGEPVEGRGVISPVDAIQLGGYHLSILSSSGKRGGLSPALSVTRSLLVPVDVPPKLRLFDGLAPVADVRLDRGPVTLGSDSDCTVRLLGVEGALVTIRPLPGGSFEIVDRGDVVLVRLKGQELRRKILENADLFDLGDDLAIRFLQGGRHARADEPDFAPSPLVDLSNGVAEAKVLGVEGVPVLRQGPPKAPAASTLVGLQAPRPPPLPLSSPSSATPTDPGGWRPEQHAPPPAEQQQQQQQQQQRSSVAEPLATQRIAPAHLPRPQDAWASAAPADMGWPMGPRSPSSTPPPPGGDPWWFSGPPPPPLPGPAPLPAAAPLPFAPPGVGMTQPLRAARPAGPPPMRRGVVALVVLGPLAAGVLVTTVLVAKLRRPPAPPADNVPAAIQEAETAPAASAEPAPSALPPASASSNVEPSAAAPADSAPPRQAPAGKPAKPGKPASAEAERLRQLRCQQYGKCD